MKKEKNYPHDAKILRDWLDSVPFREHANAIKYLCKWCYIPRSTMTNWLNGSANIRLIYKEKINQLTKAYSGKEIFTIVEPA